MSSEETVPKRWLHRTAHTHGVLGAGAASWGEAHSHSVQLLIHVFIIFIVLAQLGDKSAIGQGEQLRTLEEMQKAIRTRQHEERVSTGLDQSGYNSWMPSKGHPGAYVWRISPLWSGQCDRTATTATINWLGMAHLTPKAASASTVCHSVGHLNPEREEQSLTGLCKRWNQHRFFHTSLCVLAGVTNGFPMP